MIAKRHPPAIEVLLREHDTCRDHLANAEQALLHARPGESGSVDAAFRQAQVLFDFLEGGLESHILKEEGPLFPRLKTALSMHTLEEAQGALRCRAGRGRRSGAVPFSRLGILVLR